MNYTSNSSANKTHQLADHLRSQYHVTITVIQADIGSEDGPAQLISKARDSLQHSRLSGFCFNIIINNAGISVNQTVEEVSLQNFSNHYNINVRGPLLLMQAALPYLPNDRSGRVVNVSSVSSSLGFAGQSVSSTDGPPPPPWPPITDLALI